MHRFLPGTRLFLWTVLFTLLLTLGAAGSGRAEVTEDPAVSPIQIINQNLAYQNVSPVYLAGSDTSSLEFSDQALGEILHFVTQNFGEKGAIADLGAFALDPQQLTLNFDHEIRTYFVAEGAGFHNSLGFTSSLDGETSELQMIFGDASSPAPAGTEGDGLRRSRSEPLLPGDFVELGTFEAGTMLDFFTFANGIYDRTPDIWSTQEANNRDGLNHVVAMGLENTPYLLIGFEDLYGGGDRDYNDLMFVVDFGEENVEKLIGPEPSTLVLLALLGPLATRLKSSQESDHEVLV